MVFMNRLRIDAIRLEGGGLTKRMIKFDESPKECLGRLADKEVSK